MKIDVRDGEGVTVIAVDGEVDLSTSPRLREALQTAVGASKGVVLDLSACRYMDSSGIATLVEALQAAKKARVRLVLANVEGRVKDIFSLARLETVFPIHAGVEAAVAAARA